jgi:hypothetical protein
MRHRFLWIGGFVALGLLAAPGPVLADEILDQINEAVELYKAGDYGAAATELDFAATQIRQLQAGRISEALPAPLPGWQAEDVETTAMSASMFGGGITAERQYTKDNASVEVQVLGEAPMLQAVLMMLKNPMVMSSSGKKLTKIKGQKAAWEYDENDLNGEIQIVVANSVLVNISGSNVAEKDLKAYAEAIDYDLISKLALGE